MIDGRVLALLLLNLLRDLCDFSTVAASLVITDKGFNPKILLVIPAAKYVYFNSEFAYR